MAYIGNDLRSNEDYKIIDDISSGFNGSATSFALQVGGATPVPFPKFEQQLLISVNGVIQEPDPTGSAGFKLSGTNIVFSSAPTNGHAFFGVIYAGADYVNAGGAFPDGSINFPSITFGADTNTGFTRIASGTVALISDGTKIAQFPTSQGSSGQALVTDGAGVLSFGAVSTATSVTVADESSDTTCFPLFATAATGNLGPKSGSNLTFNSNTGVLTATSFAGDGSNLTGLTTDLVNDTSPQLGGNLDTNSKNIFFGDSSSSSNNRLQFGTTDKDLQIYHDGANSFVSEAGTGNLFVASNGGSVILFNTSNSETLAQFTGNGASELYHDGSKKLETTSTGATLTGNFIATGNLNVNDNGNINVGNGGDLQLFHNGTNSFIDSDTGNLVISSVADLRFNSSDYKFMKTSDNETLARLVQDGQVELYFDNSKKFETTANGATFLDNVRWNDNKGARFGGSDDLQIFHNGSHSIINNTTGSLQVQDSGTEKFRVSGTGTSFKDDIFIANDSDKINIGAGNDLQIFHDGTNSILSNATGIFYLKTVNGEFTLVGRPNAQTELYYDHSKKFETTSAGAKISSTTGTLRIASTSSGSSPALEMTSDSGESQVGKIAYSHLNSGIVSGYNEAFLIDGTESNLAVKVDGAIKIPDSGTKDAKLLIGAGDDLQIYHDGSNSRIVDAGTGNLIIQSNELNVKNAGNSEALINATHNGSVDLYYDNSKKFETVSAGVQVSSGHLHLPDSSELRLGSDNDFKFYHNGTSAIGQNHTGIFYFGTYSNTALILQTNNANRWAIQNTGHFVPDANNTLDIGTSSTRVRNIYTNDLNLSNEGSSNDVDGTWGNYTIQEGAEDLFLINRRNGKKFKFNLTEVA